MPQYLVRLAQAHESFRKVELQALADIAGVPLHFVKYEEDVSTFHSPDSLAVSTSSVASLAVLFWFRSRKSNPSVASRLTKAQTSDDQSHPTALSICRQRLRHEKPSHGASSHRASTSYGAKDQHTTPFTTPSAV